eukprot:129864_1
MTVLSVSMMILLAITANAQFDPITAHIKMHDNSGARTQNEPQATSIQDDIGNVIMRRTDTTQNVWTNTLVKRGTFQHIGTTATFQHSLGGTYYIELSHDWVYTGFKAVPTGAQAIPNYRTDVHILALPPKPFCTREHHHCVPNMAFPKFIEDARGNAFFVRDDTYRKFDDLSIASYGLGKAYQPTQAMGLRDRLVALSVDPQYILPVIFYDQVNHHFELKLYLRASIQGTRLGPGFGPNPTGSYHARIVPIFNGNREFTGYNVGELTHDIAHRWNPCTQAQNEWKFGIQNIADCELAGALNAIGARIITNAEFTQEFIVQRGLEQEYKKGLKSTLLGKGIYHKKDSSRLTGDAVGKKRAVDIDMPHLAHGLEMLGVGMKRIFEPENLNILLYISGDKSWEFTGAAADLEQEWHGIRDGELGYLAFIPNVGQNGHYLGIRKMKCGSYWWINADPLAILKGQGTYKFKRMEDLWNFLKNMNFENPRKGKIWALYEANPSLFHVQIEASRDRGRAAVSKKGMKPPLRTRGLATVDTQPMTAHQAYLDNVLGYRYEPQREHELYDENDIIEGLIDLELMGFIMLLIGLCLCCGIVFGLFLCCGIVLKTKYDLKF